MIISCARHSTQGNGNTVAITVLLQLHHTRKVVKVDALLKPGSDKYTLQYPVPVRGDVLFNKHTCVNHLSVVPKAHLSVVPKAHLSVFPKAHLSVFPKAHLSVRTNWAAYTHTGLLGYDCSRFSTPAQYREVTTWAQTQKLVRLCRLPSSPSTAVPKSQYDPMNTKAWIAP